MIVDTHNEVAARAALLDPLMETRICVSVQPEDEILRFVNDTGGIVVNGNLYGPVPYAEFSDVTSGVGRVADTMTITLDGDSMIVPSDETPDSVLQDVLTHPLRDRPISVGLIVLNPVTMEAIGIVPQMVGFIDQVPFTRDKRDGSKLEITVASYRAYSQRRIARTYSDTDHRTRFPGDGAAKWITNVIFRGRTFPWNSTTATSRGSTGGVSRPIPQDIGRSIF